MPKHIEADSITFTSHDGRCSLTLGAGVDSVGIILRSPGETRSIFARSDDGIVIHPPAEAAPAAPAVESITFAPAGPAEA
jgi:hypothetical protein